jgi:thioredoxin 1
MENVKELTKMNWKGTVLSADKPVLVDFWAPWCGPCRAMGPVIEKLAGEIGDKAVVGKLNVDEHPDLAGEYGVEGIPTLLVFRGGKPVNTFVGYTDAETLKQGLLSA